MSTVGETPTSLMRFTNVVLGDCARASVTDREEGYEPAFSTQYCAGGHPAAPPAPSPETWTRRGTGRLVLVPMPFSMAAATVKTLKTEPPPSPTSENGCGCTVWLSPSSSPYWRLEAIATTLWASLPGRTTLITSATPWAVGLPYVSTERWTLDWTVSSRVVRIVYPPCSTMSRLRPFSSRYWRT